MTRDFTEPGLAIGDSSVAEFWQWGFSSLADNATRGVLAEYLVGLALDAVGAPRAQWDAPDLRYHGHLVEVKSAADNQVWQQSKPSVIRFGIGKKLWWDSSAGQWADAAERPAHLYVFCHYTGRASAEEAVKLRNWTFYPVATAVLNELLPEQGSMGLKRLRQLADPLRHDELRAAVDRIVVDQAQAGSSLS